jgi:hypothetical protein
MSEFLSNNQETASEPTGWENMDVQNKALEPIIDVEDSHIEIEATPEEYERFVKDNFNKLLDNLSDPSVNMDTTSEQAINAQLAITASLLDTIDNSASDQMQTEDVFSALETKYRTLYDVHSSHGQDHNADTDQRLMEAAAVVRNQFIAYVADNKPKGPNDLHGGIIS